MPTAKTKGSCKTTKHHPDHGTELPRLNRVEGQLAGVKKMIEEQRYCPDIIQQVRATRRALAGIEISLLERHLHHCVKHAMQSKDKSAQQEKIDEIIRIFKRAEAQDLGF